MSYYKVKSVDLRDWEDIHVTVTCNNVLPASYSREKYIGTIEDLFQDFLSRNLQFNPGNRQKVHIAYLQALLYLREKDVDTYELYKNSYKENCDYDKAFKMFKKVLKEKQSKREYYIKIEGRNLYSWTKYGYSYSYYKEKKPLIDLIKAQALYGDKVTFQEA